VFENDIEFNQAAFKHGIRVTNGTNDRRRSSNFTFKPDTENKVWE